MTEEKIQEGQQYGTIKIADEAVATIASMAAANVAGVAGMSGGMASGISEKLGKKNLSKGVKVDVEDNTVVIALYLFVEFGVKIPQLAHEIQNEVRNTVENMTGLQVKEVNIHVQGISFETIEANEQEEIGE